MKRPLKYIGTAFVVLTLLLSLTVLFAPRLGWQINTVLSGSMGSTMETGSAVVSRPVDTHNIKPGDIITYRSPLNGKLTAHRVVGIEESSPRYFQTKGDANDTPDPYMVSPAYIEGKVIFDVPLLGYIADFVKTPLGFILMLGLPGLIIIVSQMRKMWVELSEEEKQKKAKVSSNVRPAE
jgi:signal peptidase